MISKNKIVIGTAQFGTSYGISNSGIILNQSEVNKIFDLADKNQISFFDTSMNYGNSEKIIGDNNNSKLSIITKLPKVPEMDKSKVELWIISQVENSIERLKVNNLYGLILHYPDQLFTSTGDIIFKSLINLKKEKKIKKIGLSIYSTDDLYRYIKNFDLDLVQAPFNIVDQRIISRKIIELLNLNNIELHVRSIFLQGLLLMSSHQIPKYFNKWSHIFKKWHEWLKIKNISALEACLAFTYNEKSIDRLVIGVNNSQQLEQIIKLNFDKNMEFPDIASCDEGLINPSNWCY